MEIGVSKRCVEFRDFSFDLRALFDKWVHSNWNGGIGSISGLEFAMGGKALCGWILIILMC